MAEYIDKTDLLERLKNAMQSEYPTNKLMVNYAHSVVLHTPTIDAVEVKHGWWEKSEDDYCGLNIIKCSMCREEWCFECGDDVKELNYHYCPNCGAKMDGE